MYVRPVNVLDHAKCTESAKKGFNVEIVHMAKVTGSEKFDRSTNLYLDRTNRSKPHGNCSGQGLSLLPSSFTDVDPAHINSVY